MTIGQRIQKARKQKGLSQQQLGEKLGVSGSMVGQYENDLRNPKFDTIVKIADALEVHPNALLPLSDAMALKNQEEIEATDREYWQRLLAKKAKSLNARGMRKAVDYVLDISRIDEYTELDDAEKPAEGD